MRDPKWILISLLCLATSILPSCSDSTTPTTTPPPTATKNYLYAVNASANTITAWQIVASDGSLTPVTSPTAVFDAPVAAAIDPASKFIAVVNRNAAGSPLTLSAQPMAIATNSTGTVAVVTTDAETVIAVPFDAVSGALGTPGTAVATGHLPRSVVFDLQDKFVYVGNQNSGTVSGFLLGSGASLTPVPGSPYTAGADTIELITTRFSSP